MAQAYYEKDGDLELLKGKVISILGYGNQGSAQAQNFRDSGVKVVVGNIRDNSFAQAEADGFPTFEIAEAVNRADYHFLLVPDEIMPRVYQQEIKPHLKPGHAIVVASGYNVSYGFLEFPQDVDVLMIAPRMIGTGVRHLYQSGQGFASLVSVEQDCTGRAKQVMLALCKAVGTLKAVAYESSCDEETLCDLFGEHFGFVYALRRAYEMLVEAGASPEAAMLELWASGEEIELARVHSSHGLFHQLALHSRTSQYGQEVTARLTLEEEEAERKRCRRLIANIKDGTFAREWAIEQQTNYPTWRSVHKENMTHPMIAHEEGILNALGVLERPVGSKTSV